MTKLEKYAGSLSRDFTEKRSFFRMSVNTNARITLTDNRVIDDVICSILSGDSLEVILDHVFDADDEFEVKFTSEDLKLRSFKAKVMAIRASTQNLDNTYTTAAKIIKIT